MEKTNSDAWCIHTTSQARNLSSESVHPDYRELKRTINSESTVCISDAKVISPDAF
jgi:hypothetical protein